MKTLFEKIYCTCLIVNGVLFALGIFMAIEELNTTTVIILTTPLMLHVIFTLLYLLIVDVILNFIWGFKIDLFPSFSGDEEHKSIDTSKFKITKKGDVLK